MRYKPAFILVALIAGLLSLVMIMKQYIGVLLQGEGSTYSVILHFNRYGELYLDGIALIGLLTVISIALVLYLKEFKEEILNE